MSTEPFEVFAVNESFIRPATSIFPLDVFRFESPLKFPLRLIRPFEVFI